MTRVPVGGGPEADHAEETEDEVNQTTSSTVSPETLEVLRAVPSCGGHQVTVPKSLWHDKAFWHTRECPDCLGLLYLTIVHTVEAETRERDARMIETSGTMGYQASWFVADFIRALPSAYRAGISPGGTA